jgi:16S rRNA (adenine1518-N6/adenine1519-N6)-dimethyltransferase
LTGKGRLPILSDLKAALRGRGFLPSKARGQNFLFDHNTLRIVAGEVAALPQDTVLEVGPGSGFLTMHLAGTAGRVLAVEVDSTLSLVAKHFLQAHNNIEVMTANILRNDDLNPEVEERLRELGDCSLIAGNLPYSAATAIISAIARSDLKPRRLVFLLQEEVARRLTADPGTSDYGSNSVITAAAFNTQLLQRIGPNVFWPKPRVSSRLVRLTPAAKVGDLPKFASFVHTLFARPKKTAVNSLLEGLARLPTVANREHPDSLREEVVSAIKSLGVGLKVRPGRLDLGQIIKLHEKLVPETLK